MRKMADDGYVACVIAEKVRQNSMRTRAPKAELLTSISMVHGVMVLYLDTQGSKVSVGSVYTAQQRA